MGPHVCHVTFLHQGGQLGPCVCHVTFLYQRPVGAGASVTSRFFASKEAGWGPVSSWPEDALFAVKKMEATSAEKNITKNVVYREVTGHKAWVASLIPPPEAPITADEEERAGQPCSTGGVTSWRL